MSTFRSLVSALFLVSCLFPAVAPAEHQADSGAEADTPPPLRAQVLDSDLRAIAGVRVMLVSERGRVLAQTASGPQGDFQFETVPPEARALRLSHPDFEDLVQPLSGWKTAYTLVPRRLEQSLTVTATRTPRTWRDIPSAVSVLGEPELGQSPAITVDDALRQIPSFSLFRRSSSLVAHPTSQGVSLRGIGPSGVSRTLVLWDGTPLNDPFGGWVYWSQLDKSSLERIEVVPGGGSSLYGSSALGGVIQAFSKTPRPPRFELDLRGGSLGTARADLLGSVGGERWSGLVSGSFFHTDGYQVVAPDDRGPVDVPASSRAYAVRAAAFYRPRQGAQGTLRLEHFGEDRGNGTLLRENATDVTRVRALYRRKDDRGREWQLGAYGLTQAFDSSFTAVPSHRQSEFLTREQRVPSRSAGGSLQWTGPLGQRHLVTSGVDWQWVRGHSRETGYRSGMPAQFQVLGGSQQLGGVYLQDLMALAPRWQLQLGARLDGWFNHDAVRDQVRLPSGTPTTFGFPRRGGGMLSPRGGVSYHASDSLTFRGAVYRSFRAPTLNELYRGFRVGNVVTLPNENLRPETLRGAEAGVDWYGGPRVRGRLTAYWNGLSQAISNITLDSHLRAHHPPEAERRPRQRPGPGRRPGAAFEPGLEAAGRLPAGRFHLRPLSGEPRGGVEPVAPGAAHRLTASLSYARPGILNAFLMARFVGLQFDDDRNLRPLAKTTLLDLHLSKRVHRNLVLTAVENLLDREIPVSNTSVLGIGPPRMITSGIRLAW